MYYDNSLAEKNLWNSSMQNIIIITTLISVVTKGHLFILSYTKIVLGKFLQIYSVCTYIYIYYVKKKYGFKHIRK